VGALVIEWIVGILTVFAFLLGLFSAIIKWGQDDDLEEYYHDTVVKTVTKPGYLPEPKAEVPREIIVDTGQKVSPIRTYLKKKIAWIRGKKVPPVILVFGHYSEEERKAFLIEKAFASSVESQLLDLDFIESLIHYLAYRCVYENEEIEEKVRIIIRKYFEASKHRDCLIRLDSLEFSDACILNPPPVKRPLLTNVVLPMVREKEKRLIQNGTIVPEMERWKSLFMNIVKCMCSKKCLVIFVGFRDDPEYFDMLENGIKNFHHTGMHVIVTARGPNIKKMDRIIEACYLFEPSKPGEEQLMACCESNYVIGFWEFSDEVRYTPCHWAIFSKIDSSFGTS